MCCARLRPFRTTTVKIAATTSTSLAQKTYQKYFIGIFGSIINQPRLQCCHFSHGPRQIFRLSASRSKVNASRPYASAYYFGLIA